MTEVRSSEADASRFRVRAVVVGGGATSCEFTSELADFLRQDVARWRPARSELALSWPRASRSGDYEFAPRCRYPDLAGQARARSTVPQ